jgi:hypothetical protein
MKRFEELVSLAIDSRKYIEICKDQEISPPVDIILAPYAILSVRNSPNRLAVQGWVVDKRSTFNGMCMYFLFDSIHSIKVLQESFTEENDCVRNIDRFLFNVHYARPTFLNS